MTVHPVRDETIVVVLGPTVSKFLLLLPVVVVSLLSSGVVETESVKYCVGVVEMTTTAARRIVTVLYCGCCCANCSFHVAVVVLACDKCTGDLGRHQLHKALEGSSYVHVVEQSYYCWNCLLLLLLLLVLSCYDTVGLCLFVRVCGCCLGERWGLWWQMVGFRGGEMANRRVFRAWGKLLGNYGICWKGPREVRL